MPSRLRWWVLTLLFLGTTVNYLDRMILGILLPEIRKDFPIDDITYGQVSSAFQFAYTIGFLLAGKLIDRIGTRFGYSNGSPREIVPSQPGYSIPERRLRPFWGRHSSSTLRRPTGGGPVSC